MAQWFSTVWLEVGLRIQSWRVYSPQEPPGEIGRWIRLAVLCIALEVILGLWVASLLGYVCVFRPLGC